MWSSEGRFCCAGSRTTSPCCELAGRSGWRCWLCPAGAWPLGTQLQVARHTCKAAYGSPSEKIQLQEKAHKKDKGLCLNAHAGFCASHRSDSGGLGILCKQRCGSAPRVLPRICGCLRAGIHCSCASRDTTRNPVHVVLTTCCSYGRVIHRSRYYKGI